jgi:branched-chain amino acid transport system ATP-binding protein
VLRRASGAAAPNILEARGITKVFGGLVAVNAGRLRHPQRSIVSLIGPNGAGKTTFFNMVSGLYKPTAGSFVFLGKDVTRLGAHRRAQMGIGRTFQNIRLFGNMSALENVLTGMHVRLESGILSSILRTSGQRREEEEARERCVELLRFVGLRTRETFAKNLPYGDQRRLEIARALASEPKLLLLDEPTAGMNPQEDGADYAADRALERRARHLRAPHRARDEGRHEHLRQGDGFGPRREDFRGGARPGARGPQGYRSVPRHREDGLERGAPRSREHPQLLRAHPRLEGVSLTVEEGEIVTLIGSNGAGKTTTLRSIHGILPPREGGSSFEVRRYRACLRTT